MEVVGSIPAWNSKIFSVVPCLVAKQPSLTSFIHGCIQRHSMFHVLVNENHIVEPAVLAALIMQIRTKSNDLTHELNGQSI